MKHSSCIYIMSTVLEGGTHIHYMEMAELYSFCCHVLLAEYD